ncbi:hypothetical protein [Streptomyces cahuitamycinicus]|uniref:Uncharacterized protein n=1 Tax=Streptomyces cahuitamycinicus TaxID=2070367 RepID=A0A2N8TMS8_9ACTN|nr:hypothetical protein [Streptomyces cahuitamycinicus]PNG20320.1 hypothetical protein C1J00_20875 [Streptomyces cahuitamycinicus]
MDATTLGSLLVGIGAVAAAVVAYLGKRGENAVTGYSSLTNDLQEERDALKAERTELNAKLAELSALRAADQAEIARLRALIPPGGHP